MTQREGVCVCMKEENVICLDWTIALQAYEHQPEEGQRQHCVAGQSSPVLGQEAIIVTGSLSSTSSSFSSDLNVGGHRGKVTLGAVITE